MPHEIELKSLLITTEKAEELRKTLLLMGAVSSLPKQEQLNHYFTRKNPEPTDDARKELSSRLLPLLNSQEVNKILDILYSDPNCSTKTRLIRTEQEVQTLLVIKQGQDPINGNIRKENEWTFESDCIQEVDQLLLDSLFDYQAKWSRERETYTLQDFTISLDKNPGYGWVCELETMTENEQNNKKAEMEIVNFMRELDLEELPKDRLGRMFEFYNKNWETFYGTDNYFVIY